jgi:hypothetical protein
MPLELASGSASTAACWRVRERQAGLRGGYSQFLIDRLLNSWVGSANAAMLVRTDRRTSNMAVLRVWCSQLHTQFPEAEGKIFLTPLPCPSSPGIDPLSSLLVTQESFTSLKAESSGLSRENKASNIQETIAGAVSKINFFIRIQFWRPSGAVRLEQKNRFYVKPEDKPRS